MAISFNETFYLEQKLAQLQAAGEAGFETTADVQEAFAAAGLTAEAHYLQYGASEGLNPSADFDTNVYLDSKLAQLSTAGGFENITTREALATFLKDSGFSPLEHYNQHGAAEGVSPSAEFNAQAYLANKLADLQANDTDGTYADWTTDTLLAFFNDNGLTPLDHYTQFGRVENISPLPVEETSGLTEALGNLATAQKDLATKLEGLELDTNYDGEIDVEAGNANRTEVTTALNSVTAALDTELGATGAFVAAGTNTKQGMIADGRATLQKGIDDAQKALDTAEAGVGSNILSALSTVENRKAAYEAAIDAAAAADKAENGEQAKFIAVNDSVNVVAGGEDDNASTDLSLDGVVVAKLTNGQWTVEETPAAETKLDGLIGFDTYLAALQEETDKAAAEAQAKESLKAALAKVVALENEDDTITADDISDDMITVGADAEGNADVSVSLTAQTAVADPTLPAVDETQAGSAGAKETFTATITGSMGDGSSNTVTFDGVPVSVAASASAADIAAALGGATYQNWTVDIDSSDYGTGVVVFVASDVGNVDPDVANTDFTFTDTGTSGDAAAAVSNIVDGAAAEDEVNTVTFTDLNEGQSVNVAGVSLTATEAMTADDVAAHFAAEDFTGTGWSVASSTGADVVFNSTVSGENVTNIQVSVGSEALGGTAPEAQDVLDKRVALESAQEALQDLNDIVSDWEAAVQLDADVTDLEKAVTAAREAIENTEEDGGLGITLLEGADNFTAESDVYLFNKDDSAGVSLSGFGANGEDKIFFGEGFTLVEITDDKGINGNIGDASVKEIFWEQDGNNVNLYVEAETFGGNSAGTADVTKITLTGVDGADISDDLGNGFLSAGSVEVA